MTINRMDAEEISRFVADSFRTRVSHLREDLTSDEYQKIYDTCQEVLAAKIDNKNILNKQLNPATGEVTDVEAKD